jgi:hypothetical protein
LSDSKENALVVHLIDAPDFWKGRVDTRVVLPSVVGGLVIVTAAALREALSGGGQFLASVLVGVALVGLLFFYGYMRLWNATVFFRGGKLGITNWLGFSRSVPASSVDHFHRMAEVWTGETLPRGVLFIVTKDRKRSLRFAGGDRLEPGGLERLAANVGVSIQGSWTDLPTWRP